MTKTMTKAMSAVLTGAALTAVVLVSAGCAPGAASAAPLASNTAEICPAYVKLANLGHNKTGNARTEAEKDAAWADLITSTRATAAQATDVTLKADLTLVADGMTRIAAEPGDLFAGFDSLENSDPAYYATINAASDRLEATCGPITGIV